MITKIGNIFFIGIFSLLFVSSFAYGIDSLALAIKNSQGQTTQKIAVGSPFYVVLTIKGNYKGKIPVIPGLERITQLGTQTSSSYSSDGQKASQKVVFMYQVQSYNLATYTFGPLVLDYEGNSYTALPVEVEIIKDQPVQVLQQAEQDTLLKIALSKKSMVLGEDFFVTLKFYTRLVGVEIKDISPLELADAEVSPWEQIGQKEEIYNGEHYQTITVRSRIQPKKSGTFILPSMRVIYTKPVQNNQGQQNVFNLFSVFLGATHKKEQLTTDPISFAVIELPKTDKLVQAVGTFNDFIVTIDKDQARQGEAFIVTAKVTGESAQEHLAAPVLVLPEHFRSYPSRAQTVDAAEEKDRARIFEYIVQGTETGIFDFPEQQFTFFDPSVKRYKTLKSPGLKLTVTGSAKEIKDKKKELEEPLKENSLDKKSYFSRIDFSDYYSLFLIVLLVGLLLLIIGIIKKPFLAYYLSWKITRKRSAAFADTYKKIVLEEKRMHPDILALFITLFSKKLSVPESSLTYDELCLALPESKLTEVELHAWQDFLDALFSLKFGTKQEDRSAHIALLFQQAKKWLIRLENR